MKNTAKIYLFLIKKKKMSTAILKNSPTVRGNVPSGHFEKKNEGPPPSYFSKKQDAKHVFFLIWPYNTPVSRSSDISMFHQLCGLFPYVSTPHVQHSYVPTPTPIFADTRMFRYR